jgi:hypothetical protein
LRGLLKNPLFGYLLIGSLLLIVVALVVVLALV